MPKTILITGVAGFLGSNLAADLVGHGHNVIGLDNLSMGRLDNLTPLLSDPRFVFFKRDVTDPAAFADVDIDLDCVVHLAAFKIPRYGNAIDTLRINYRGTENALELAVRAECKCVLASTSDVYGRNPKLPFAEGDESVIGSSKVARWSYAVSKLFDEHLGFAYQDSYGIPVTALRFFGSYGPRQPLSWWGARRQCLSMRPSTESRYRCMVMASRHAASPTSPTLSLQYMPLSSGRKLTARSSTSGAHPK